MLRDQHGFRMNLPGIYSRFTYFMSSKICKHILYFVSFWRRPEECGRRIFIIELSFQHWGLVFVAAQLMSDVLQIDVILSTEARGELVLDIEER